MNHDINLKRLSRFVPKDGDQKTILSDAWIEQLRKSLAFNNPEKIASMSDAQLQMFVDNVYQTSRFKNQGTDAFSDAIQIDVSKCLNSANDSQDARSTEVFVDDSELYSSNGYSFTKHMPLEQTVLPPSKLEEINYVFDAGIDTEYKTNYFFDTPISTHCVPDVPQVSQIQTLYHPRNSRVRFTRLNYYSDPPIPILGQLMKNSFEFFQPNQHYPYPGVISSIGRPHAEWVGAYKSHVKTDTVSNRYEMVSQYLSNKFRHAAGLIGQDDIDTWDNMHLVWAYGEEYSKRQGSGVYPSSMSQLFGQTKNMLAMGFVPHAHNQQNDHVRSYPVIRDIAYAMLRNGENHRNLALYMQAYRGMLHRKHGIYFEDYDQCFEATGNAELANILDDQACAFASRLMLLQAILRYPCVLLDVFSEENEFSELVNLAQEVKFQLRELITVATGNGVYSENTGWQANPVQFLLQDFPAQPSEVSTHSSAENLMYESMHRCGYLMLFVFGTLAPFKHIGPYSHVVSTLIQAPYFNNLFKLADPLDKNELVQIPHSISPKMFLMEQIKAQRSVVLEMLFQTGVSIDLQEIYTDQDIMKNYNVRMENAIKRSNAEEISARKGEGLMYPQHGIPNAVPMVQPGVAVGLSPQGVWIDAYGNQANIVPPELMQMMHVNTQPQRLPLGRPGMVDSLRGIPHGNASGFVDRSIHDRQSFNRGFGQNSTSAAGRPMTGDFSSISSTRQVQDRPAQISAGHHGNEKMEYIAAEAQLYQGNIRDNREFPLQTRLSEPADYVFYTNDHSLSFDVATRSNNLSMAKMLEAWKKGLAIFHIDGTRLAFYITGRQGQNISVGLVPFQKFMEDNQRPVQHVAGTSFGQFRLPESNGANTQKAFESPFATSNQVATMSAPTIREPDNVPAPLMLSELIQARGSVEKDLPPTDKVSVSEEVPTRTFGPKQFAKKLYDMQSVDCRVRTEGSGEKAYLCEELTPVLGETPKKFPTRVTKNPASKPSDVFDALRKDVVAFDPSKGGSIVNGFDVAVRNTDTENDSDHSSDEEFDPTENDIQNHTYELVSMPVETESVQSALNIVNVKREASKKKYRFMQSVNHTPHLFKSRKQKDLFYSICDQIEGICCSTGSNIVFDEVSRLLDDIRMESNSESDYEVVDLVENRLIATINDFIASRLGIDTRMSDFDGYVEESKGMLDHIEEKYSRIHRSILANNSVVIVREALKCVEDAQARASLTATYFEELEDEAQIHDKNMENFKLEYPDMDEEDPDDIYTRQQWLNSSYKEASRLIWFSKSFTVLALDFDYPSLRIDIPRYEAGELDVEYGTPLFQSALDLLGVVSQTTQASIDTSRFYAITNDGVKMSICASDRPNVVMIRLID